MVKSNYGYNNYNNESEKKLTAAFDALTNITNPERFHLSYPALEQHLNRQQSMNSNENMGDSEAPGGFYDSYNYMDGNDYNDP